MYKNNQTTSTKCQYHAAASNPKWWFDEKCNAMCRNRHVVRNVVPIITCSPWNPVATKMLIYMLKLQLWMVLQNIRMLVVQ